MHHLKRIVMQKTLAYKHATMGEATTEANLELSRVVDKVNSLALNMALIIAVLVVATAGTVVCQVMYTVILAVLDHNLTFISSMLNDLLATFTLMPSFVVTSMHHTRVIHNLLLILLLHTMLALLAQPILVPIRRMDNLLVPLLPVQLTMLSMPEHSSLLSNNHRSNLISLVAP